MNGFLVLGRAIFDDVPVRLLPTKDLAHTFARLLTEDDILSVARGAKLDITSVECVSVTEFRDSTPVSQEIIKEFNP